MTEADIRAQPTKADAPKFRTDSHVLITGTTSGIGRGLLKHYVQAGAPVTAVNRHVDPDLEAQYPMVRFQHMDVRDANAIKNLILQLAKEGEIPNIFILNAGVNRIDNDAALDLAQFKEILEINLLGVIHFVAPLTTLGTWARKIKVIAISSSTNYVGNPYCLGYYISKKAVTHSFEVLSAMYEKTNLQFKWVVLGPVPTAIESNSEKFPKTMALVKEMFSVSVDAAVRAIARFASSDRPRLVFPLRSFVLFQGVRLAQRIIPGFFRGRKTLAGRLRGT